MKTDKKKKLYRVAIISLVVFYVLFVSVFLHVSIVMRESGLPVQDAFWLGLKDMFIRPFAVFPIPPGTLMWLIIVTTAMVVMGVLIYLDEISRRHYDPNVVLGSAQWMADLDRYNTKFSDPIGKPTHDGPNNIVLSEDLYLAMDNEKTRRNLNTFIIGGSGSGKSYNFVGPNIMQANSSYVVTDPSGGLYKQYGSFLEYMGYHVKCFNLSRMDQGNHYNPFNYIHSDKDVEILVTTLISNTNPPEKTGGDPFWEKSETALLVALIAYLFHYCKKEMQNFTSVMKLMRAADISEEESTTKSKLDLAFEEVENREPESFAVKQYKTFKMGAGKTLKSILISCAVRLQAFDLEDVANLTSKDDIDLEHVGDEKTALFIIIPTGEKTFNFLASMMYSQLFQRLYGFSEDNAKYSSLVMDGDNQVIKTFRADGPGEIEEKTREEAEQWFEKAKKAEIVESEIIDGGWELRTVEKDRKGELIAWRGGTSRAKTKEEMEKARQDGLLQIQKAKANIIRGRVISNREQSNNGERLPIHTRLILDEFANIGKIPEFPEKVATIRKYEISVAIILQSLSQMKKMYKDEWEELSGNCDTTIYLGGGADQMTTEWISKLLGKETRVVLGSSHDGKGGGNSSFNRQAVELFAPDQLRTMHEDDCVVLVKSEYAFRGRKFMSHLHPNRNLVKSLPEYTFNAKKSETLLKETMIEKSVKNIIENKRKGIKEETTQEKENREKENEYNEQKADELRNNRDQNGEEVFGHEQEIRKSKSEVADKIGITDKNRETDVSESLEMTDDVWGINEMEFVAKARG